MKATLPLVTFFCLFSFSASAQDLAYDQNPNYKISQDKYMRMADSVNRLHGTTLQETYKAIDYLADKAEAREKRREYRQQRRMNSYLYDWDYYDYRPSHQRYGRYRYWHRPYIPYRNDRFWGSLPWAVTFGLLCR